MTDIACSLAEVICSRMYKYT